MKGDIYMTDMQMIAAGLTPTQIRYIRAYLDGKTQKEIAQEYVVQPSTVSHTLKTARQKLQSAGIPVERQTDLSDILIF